MFICYGQRSTCRYHLTDENTAQDRNHLQQFVNQLGYHPINHSLVTAKIYICIYKSLQSKTRQRFFIKYFFQVQPMERALFTDDTDSSFKKYSLLSFVFMFPSLTSIIFIFILFDIESDVRMIERLCKSKCKSSKQLLIIISI